MVVSGLAFVGKSKVPKVMSVLLALWMFKRWLDRKILLSRTGHVPYMSGRAYFGVALEFAPDPFVFTKEAHDKFGNIFLAFLFSRPCIFLRGGKLFEQITMDIHRDRLETNLKFNMKKMLGSQISSWNGERHKKIRERFAHHLGYKALQYYLEPAIKLFTEVVDHWGEQTIPIVDVKKDIKRAVSRLNWVGIFGEDFPQSERESLEQLCSSLGKAMYAFPLNLPYTQMYEALQSRPKIDNVLIREMKRRSIIPGSQNRRDFFQSLLNDHQRGFMTEKEFLNNVVTILFAVSDSTASFLTLLVNAAGIVPGAIARIREETSGDLKKLLEFNKFDRASIEYTTSFVKEVIRLSGGARTVRRTVIQDITIYEGSRQYTIPAGTDIVFSLKATAVFDFEDATKFRPERYMNGNSDDRLPQYSPFGVGYHRCPGMFLARFISSVFICCLAKYDVSIEGDAFSLDAGLSDTKRPLRIRLLKPNASI